MQEQNQHIKALLERCKQNDTTAQFEIYKLYYKAMYNTALRILQDSFEAEDAMQEAFLNAFTKLHTYKGEVAFGAWLKRIVINRSLTQLKKNNKVDEVNLEVVSYKLEDEGEPLGDIENVDSIKVKEILKSINQLKENYRMVLQLSLIEGYDNEEIASILNISHENCRTTISRAKSKLRNMLKPAV